jgi:hypothetical protein
VEQIRDEDSSKAKWWMIPTIQNQRALACTLPKVAANPEWLFVPPYPIGTCVCSIRSSALVILRLLRFCGSSLFAR